MTASPISADQLRSLWQTMPTETIVITADEMRTRARRFQNRVRRRNFIEYAAFVVIVFSFGHYIWIFEDWRARAANLLIILGAAVAVWNLHRRGRAVATPADASAMGLVEFQRAEFIRQRKVLLTAWRWYFLPFVPGFVCFSVVAWTGHLRDDIPLDRLRHNIIMTDIVFVAILVIGILAQLLAAAHLQRRIEDLDRYKEQ